MFAAANGSSIVAYVSAAAGAASGASRLVMRHTSKTLARYDSAAGRRAAHGSRPNAATLAAIAQ